VRPVAVLSATILLAGCAYIGNPKPPTLDIPLRVTDLRAAEYGDQILVQFTIAPLTTEGLPLMSLESAEVRAATGPAAAAGQNYSIPATAPGPVSYQFAARDWIGKQIALTVRATGPKGKTSERSNPVALDVRPPLATPAHLHATSVPQGVRLTWEGSGARFRIFRGAGEVVPSPFAESDKPEYIDTMADFGAPYKYFVQAIDGNTHQSRVSETVGITPMDTFPPAVPEGVTAVAGVNAIELVWERNTEDDFAGYSIYRSADGGAFERVAGPIDAPTYSDRAVDAGKKYSYAVTAIDKAGNESERSTVVDVIAQ
jgi:fibronectin type 3 domain-containing protein